MTAAAEAQALALHEAQRLLDEHGPWETGRGTYLESRDVAVLVQPAPSAPDGPGDAAGRGVDRPKGPGICAGAPVAVTQGVVRSDGMMAGAERSH